MKFRNILSVLGLICSVSLLAQTSDNGFYLLKMGQLNSAKAAFSKKIAQNSLDSRSFSGLGEYYLQINLIDSALANFNRGIVASKNDAYNYLGLAKTAFLKGDNLTAAAKLDLARKYGKKDAFVFTEIARIYYGQKDKNQEEITKALAKAKEINYRCYDYYLLLAKIAADKNNFSDAANQYESAIFFDSLQFEAYIAYSRILISAQNSKNAIGYLNTLIQKTPECVVAYRELGDVLFDLGKYEGSAQNYAKYVEKAEYTSEEKERYAYSLFFSQDYDNARKIIAELSGGKPDNYIMLRLLAYTHFQKGEYFEGVDMFNKFFNKIPENKVLTLDYEYFGKTLEKAKMDSLAAIQYQNAFTKDSTRTYLIDEIAKAYTRYKAYEKAAEWTLKSFQRKQNPQASDYYRLALAYYFAGNAKQNPADLSIKKDYFLKADTLFGSVISINPKAHLALLNRARMNYSIETETTPGLAKPYYEKALELFNANPEKFKKEIIETYRYLGSYYFQKNDHDTVKSYFQKIIAIDSTDEQSIKVLEGYKNSKP